MTDDQPDLPDDIPPGLRQFLGAIEIPLEGIREDEQRRHLRAHDRQNRLYAFLDGLDPEGLLVLRSILNNGGEDGAWASNQYIDGMVVTLLRIKHDVDPDHPEDDPRLQAPEPVPETGDDGHESDRGF